MSHAEQLQILKLSHRLEVAEACMERLHAYCEEALEMYTKHDLQGTSVGCVAEMISVCRRQMERAEAYVEGRDNA